MTGSSSCFLLGAFFSFLFYSQKNCLDCPETGLKIIIFSSLTSLVLLLVAIFLVLRN